MLTHFIEHELLCAQRMTFQIIVLYHVWCPVGLDTT